MTHSPMRCDLRLCLRQWRRNKALAGAIILLLGIGIGSNAMIFSFIESILLKPMPVRDPSNLFLIKKNRQKQPRPDTEFFYAVFEKIAARKDLFSSAVAEQEWTDDSFLPLETADNVRVISTAIVSPDYFVALGLQPALGRLLSPADAQLTTDIPIVISYQFWRSQFGGNRDVIGRVLRLRNFPFRIVGVAPREFHSIDVERAPDVRVPISASQVLYQQTVSEPSSKRELSFQVLLRLAPGVTPAGAVAAVTPTARRISEMVWRELERYSSLPAARRSENIRYASEFQIGLEPAARGVSRLRTQFSSALYVLMGGVALLMLAVCANVSGLLLARGEQRRKEIAIRRSMGASTAHLLGQFFTENLLLAGAGAVLGIALAYAGAPLWVRLLPSVTGFSSYATPPIVEVEMNRYVLLFAVSLSVLSVLFFGLIPALRALRTNANEDLKGTGPGVTKSLSSVASVSVQVALGVILTAGAVLVFKTFWNLEHLNPGFDRLHLVEVSLDPRAAGYSEAQANTFLRDVQARITELPGVRSAASASGEVMHGVGMKTTIAPQGVVLPEKTFLNTTVNSVSPQYFATMGIAILAGRNLEHGDEKKKPQPIVINTALADLLFPHENPIGKLVVAGTDGRKTPDDIVVGLVGTAKFRSFREDNPPIFYAGRGSGTIQYARTYGDPAALVGHIRNLLRRVDPRVPVAGLTTLEAKVQTTLWQERLLTLLAGFFGMTSLALAAAGVYGALDYSVTARRREIGIRIAVGAAPHDIVRAVIARMILAVAGGLLIGTVAAGALLGMAGRLLFGVQPLDPSAFLITSAAMLLCAAAMAMIPVIRALNTNPVTALRAE